MNLNRIFKRKPAGVPAGGQFEHDRKAEADVTLSPPPAEADPFRLKYGDETPYGPAEPFRDRVEGVQQFGSLYNEDGQYVRLSEERNAAIPEEYRNENGFYACHGDPGRPKATERDVVIVTHPDAFEAEEVEWAKDLIAVRDAPQDVQEDLGEVSGRAAAAQSKADELRRAVAAHEAAERKWAASTVAAGTLEQFPQAKEVSYLLHGDNLVGDITVSDGEKELGSLIMEHDGRIIGTGHEAGQDYLHTIVRKLENVPDAQMAEQGAEVGPANSNGERTVTIPVAAVLDNAAERVRDEKARWR